MSQKYRVLVYHVEGAVDIQTTDSKGHELTKKTAQKLASLKLLSDAVSHAEIVQVIQPVNKPQ